MYVTVKGGTNAGRRRVYNLPKEPWTCPSCSTVNKPNFRNCWTCQAPRSTGEV